MILCATDGFSLPLEPTSSLSPMATRKKRRAEGAVQEFGDESWEWFAVSNSNNVEVLSQYFVDKRVTQWKNLRLTRKNSKDGGR